MDRHGSAASSVRSPVGSWLVRSLRGDARPLNVVALVRASFRTSPRNRFARCWTEPAWRRASPVGGVTSITSCFVVGGGLERHSPNEITGNAIPPSARLDAPIASNCEGLSHESRRSVAWCRCVPT